MSDIIDGWGEKEKPVNKIMLSPGSRAWLHRFGLESHMYREEKLDGNIPEFSYSYTVNTSGNVSINNGEKND